MNTNARKQKARAPVEAGPEKARAPSVARPVAKRPVGQAVKMAVKTGPARLPGTDPPVPAVPPSAPPQPSFGLGARGDQPLSESPELPALINYIRDGRCVLFVGAGLSRSAGLPSWHELMHKLVEPAVALAGGEATEPELRALLEKGRYPELAGHCRELLGYRPFYDIVHQELAARGELPEIYRDIVETPYASIVTTNFDTLLEDAFARWDDRGIPKTPTGADLAQQGTMLLDGAFFLLKAHGDLSEQHTMIFTAEDYRRVIHANPAFQAVLSSLLLTRAVLFIGYSLGDPNFRLLLDSQLTIFNEQVPPRYAVMTEVGKVEQDILWRTARIRVLPYAKGRHEEVGRFVRTIRERVERRLVGASPLSAPRGTLGMPEPVPAATLAIRGRGERLDFDLYRETGGLRETIFSGGGCRPALQELDAKVGTWRAEWTLSEVARVGAFLLQSDFAELADHLAALPEQDVVVLACSPDAEVIPWEWLIVEGTPLCLRSPVVRRSVGLSEKARGLRFVGQPLRALVIADTGEGSAGFAALPGARAEAQDVKKVIETRSEGGVVTLLLGKEASYERVIHEVERGNYDIIHFAGHAGCDESESFLVMNDGLVRSSELVSLLNRRPPAFMMLNSELTAFVPPVRGISGGSALGTLGKQWPLYANPRGFDRMAARSGVSAFIGVFRDGLLDEPAATLATSTYAALLDGLPAAAALLHARKACMKFNDVTGCFYTLSGHAHLRLAQPRSPAFR